MPNATFLVTLNLDTIDPVSLANETEDLTSELEKNFDVIEVKPWAHPSAVTQTGGSPITTLQT